MMGSPVFSEISQQHYSYSNLPFLSYNLFWHSFIRMIYNKRMEPKIIATVNCWLAIANTHASVYYILEINVFFLFFQVSPGFGGS